MKSTKTFLFAVLMYLPAAQVLAQNWSVRLGEDGLNTRTTCLLESASQWIFDGQTRTPIKLVYNGDALIAVTKSNIDLSYEGVGLQVDERELHSVDKLHKKTRAIFNKYMDDLIQEFIKGKQASLVLGFWPSWPKTRTVISRFSLRGFTRAYRAFQDCQTTGVVKQ